LKRLSSELARDITKEFDLVKYSSAVTQKMDDIENTRSFAKLLVSEDEDTRTFANDLIKYAYITGGIQNANSFIKYIPAQVLMHNDFSSGLRDLQASLNDVETEGVDYISFLRQYFQHNPYKAVKIDEVKLLGVKDVYNFAPPDTFTVSANSNNAYEKNLVSVNSKLADDKSDGVLGLEQSKVGFESEKTVPKFAYIYDLKYKKPILYEASETANGFVYTKIGLLGTDKLGVVEYDANSNNTQSLLKNKQVNSQKEIQNEPVVIENKTALQEVKLQEVKKPENEITETPSNDLLIKHLTEIANGSGTYSELAKLLLQDEAVKSAKLGLFTQDDLQKDLENGRTTPLARANSTTKEIKFNKASFNKMRDYQLTLLHETLHISTVTGYNAYTLDKEAYTKANPEKGRIYKQLDLLRETVIKSLESGKVIKLKNGSTLNHAGYLKLLAKQLKTDQEPYNSEDEGFYYGLTNTKEFISVVMTDPMMQEALSNIEYSGNKSLFDRLADLFKRFVNTLSKERGIKVDNTILEESVANVLDLISMKKDTNVEDKLINIYSTDLNGFNKLSNLIAGPVTINISEKAVVFKTIEHAYQAQKALFANDRDAANKIFMTKDGFEAQKLGRTVKGLDSKSWDLKSENVLKDIMAQYYNQNEAAKNLLLSTGNAQLTHKSKISLGKWETVFPKLLMEIRDSIQKEEQKADKKKEIYINTADSKVDNMLTADNLSKHEKELLKTKKLKLMRTKTGQAVVTLPMKPQEAYNAARKEVAKINKEHGDNTISIVNRVVVENKKEVSVEAVKVNVSDNVISVDNLDAFLSNLTPSERLLFRKLKLNNSIETQCK
jgi:ribA/ribD-fused uncharacterized protein